MEKTLRPVTIHHSNRDNPNDKKGCYFHEWIQVERTGVYAIIELPDGTVELIPMSKVLFDKKPNGEDR